MNPTGQYRYSGPTTANDGGTVSSNPSVADNDKDEHIAMLNKMKEDS